MPHRLRGLVAERARNRCEYCRAPEALSNSLFDLDHIQPRRDGGADDESNLALACRACNGSKQTATSALDPVSGHLVRLYNPRIDLWSEHFRADIRSGDIVGQTEIGRATAARLRMNGSRQSRVRRLWIYLFGFPDDPPVLHPEPDE